MCKKIFVLILTVGVQVNCSGQKFSEDSYSYVKYNNIDINDSLKHQLTDELKWITPMNLSFALGEFLFMLKTDDLFKIKWEEKLKNYYKVFNDSLSYAYTNEQISFFERTLNKNTLFSVNYPDELRYLNNNKFKTKLSYKKLDPIQLLRKYQFSDEKDELSSIFYNLLILDGRNFIKHAEKDRVALSSYKVWLNDINDHEFVVYESINTSVAIIKRKRDYILVEYSQEKNPLMQRTLETIRKSKIQMID